jgi:hypothetical protein
MKPTWKDYNLRSDRVVVDKCCLPVGAIRLIILELLKMEILITCLTGTDDFGASKNGDSYYLPNWD